jgi:hypothetical protein
LLNTSWNGSASGAVSRIPGPFCPHRPGISQAALRAVFLFSQPGTADQGTGCLRVSNHSAALDKLVAVLAFSGLAWLVAAPLWH